MKKLRLIFFSFFIIIFLFAGINICYAIKLNAGYPPIPLAPAINSNSELPDFIKYFFFAGVYIVGTLAVVSIVIGGIRLIMAAENPSRVSGATDQIKAAIIGLALLLGAVVIMNTINPKLTQLELTVPPIQATGLVLSGSAGDISAPEEVDDFQNQYGGQYERLSWKNNCDDNAYDYMVYIYSKTNLKSVDSYGKLKCGDGSSINVGKDASYLAVKEYPGVYFYSTLTGCVPGQGTDEQPVTSFSSSIPDMSKTSIGVGWPRFDNANIRYVRIIDGPGLGGPFFGAALFTDINYYGRGMWHWDPGYRNNNKNDEDQGCKEIVSWLGAKTGTNISSIQIASAIIYQKADYQNRNAGAGVVLNQQREGPEGNGGLYCPKEHPDWCMITGDDVAQEDQSTSGEGWSGDLSKMPVQYLKQRSPIPWDEQQICPYFYSSKSSDKCFQSMSIDGNFLVILSYYEDTAGGNEPSADSCIWDNCFQAFPTPDQQDGPPDINATAIKTVGARYIYILPLAQQLFPPPSQ